MNLKIWMFLSFCVLLDVSCVDMDTIRPITARDFYESGLAQIDKENYKEALRLFNKCISVGDPIADEYFVSMCYFDKAFSYSENGDQKEALQTIEILLSQVVTSKEPRILAENLRHKIISGNPYQRSTF